MSKKALDQVDRTILATLQANGRLSNAELAKQLGISAPPCLRRVRALEQAGFIKNYQANLNSELLGFGLTVFAFVGLSSQAEADLNAFAQQVYLWPEVRECHMLSGEIDFILKVVTKDLEAFQDFLSQKLLCAKHVETVKTSLTLKENFIKTKLPLSE